MDWVRELTKDSGVRTQRDYAAFGSDQWGGWSLGGGFSCIYNAGGIESGALYPNWGQQNAWASRTLPDISKGEIEFSFTVSLSYNSGSNLIWGFFYVNIWDNLQINHDNVSIALPNGTRQTLFTGLGANSVNYTSHSIYVKASSSHILLIIDGSRRYETDYFITNLTDNISFTSQTGANYNGVNFATRSRISAPGVIKLR